MKTVDRPTATPDRLLDAAETLFAEEGFRATTLRAITARAGVNLAAANYHFGSKRHLLEAVIARRMQPLNAERLERLRLLRGAARVAGRRPRVREIVLAMMETIIGRERSVTAEHFAAFVGRSFFDSDPVVRKAFSIFMRPTFGVTLDALAEALPGLPRATLFWRLQFAIGAVARVNLLTQAGGTVLAGTPHADRAALVEEIVAFVSAGMTAPVAAHPRRCTGTRRNRS